MIPPLPHALVTTTTSRLLLVVEYATVVSRYWVRMVTAMALNLVAIRNYGSKEGCFQVVFVTVTAPKIPS